MSYVYHGSGNANVMVTQKTKREPVMYEQNIILP